MPEAYADDGQTPNGPLRWEGQPQWGVTASLLVYPLNWKSSIGFHKVSPITAVMTRDCLGLAVGWTQVGRSHLRMLRGHSVSHRQTNLQAPTTNIPTLTVTRLWATRIKSREMAANYEKERGKKFLWICKALPDSLVKEHEQLVR